MVGKGETSLGQIEQQHAGRWEIYLPDRVSCARARNGFASPLWALMPRRAPSGTSVYGIAELVPVMPFRTKMDYAVFAKSSRNTLLLSSAGVVPLVRAPDGVVAGTDLKGEDAAARAEVSHPATLQLSCQSVRLAGPDCVRRCPWLRRKV